MWVVEIVNWPLDHKLSDFGILPRSIRGLVGIPLSPFLHAGFDHLMLNTVPMLFLGTLVTVQGKRTYILATVFIVFLGGGLLWAFGRDAVHVGASGLIFGYFGYLIARAWYDRGFGSLIVAVAVVFLYGSLIFGVLPTVPGVSWEGHLFGLAAGVLAARTLWRRPSRPSPA